MLGAGAVKNFFDEDIDPVGQTIRVNSLPFRVIGVMAEQPASGFVDENDVPIIVEKSASAKMNLNGPKIPEGYQRYMKSIEKLRYRSPGEWGKLIGLDRIPEVRTLRKKIRELSSDCMDL